MLKSYASKIDQDGTENDKDIFIDMCDLVIYRLVYLQNPSACDNKS